MHRFNAYHGQTVLESQLDAMFDDCENAERNLAIDGHVRQVPSTDTPDPSNYGGILAGLVVTASPGDDHVHVALGTARDYLGKRIDLATAATVLMLNTGATTVGDSTDATGDAGAIVGSCSAGKYIIASLFIVYDEVLSDPKVDALGATIQYDIAESFKFDIQIGASFTHANVIAVPPTETPARAALASNKVLLADILLTNSAGAMQVVAICTCDADWDYLTGNYATLAGRRASWFSASPALEFSHTDLENLVGGTDTDIARGNSAREALYALAKKVRSQAVVASRPEGYPQLFSKRTIYGHPARPHELFDDFVNYDLYYNFPQYGCPWYAVGITGSVGAGQNYLVTDTTNPGGVIQMITKNTINEGLEVRSGTGWKAGAAPWAIGMFRFKIATGSGAVVWAQFGLAASTLISGANRIVVTYDPGTGLFGASVVGASSSGSGSSLGAVAENTWYTLRIAVFSNVHVAFQLNNNTVVEVKNSGANALGDVVYRLMANVTTSTGASGSIFLDQAHAADGQLSSDMA